MIFFPEAARDHRAIDIASHEFSIPTKEIHNTGDIDAKWHKSEVKLTIQVGYSCINLKKSDIDDMKLENLFELTQNDTIGFPQAYRDLLGFIDAMNSSVKGKKIRDEYFVSEVRHMPILNC